MVNPLISRIEELRPKLVELAELGEGVFQLTQGFAAFEAACQLLHDIAEHYQHQEQWRQAARYWKEIELIAPRFGSGWGMAAHERLRDWRREKK